ncbi:DedA family protein [Patescibacteria group bacterium]
MTKKKTKTTITDKSREKSQKKYKLLSTILAIAISIAIIFSRDYIHQFKNYGYMGIFIISLIGNATLFLPTPVLITTAALGAALNPIMVGLIASLGAALGESVGYFVGLGGNIVVEKSDTYKKIKNQIDKYGYWGIVFLASIPNPLFDLAGIMSGALGITYFQFFFATWMGSFIKYTLTSTFGLTLGELFQ